MNRNTQSLVLVFIAVVLTVLCPGCRLVTVVPLDTESKTQFYYEDSNFDPEKYAAEVWEQIVQFSKENAAPLSDVLALYSSAPDACGQKYGRRPAEQGSTWNYIVSGKGRVLAVNRASKNGLLEIDLEPYDGAADCLIQIGPVLKGTAIRDAMPFISFADFRNQLTFGDVAKAINSYSGDNVSAKLPLDTLAGQTVDFLGVFTQGDTIALMPVELSAYKE